MSDLLLGESSEKTSVSGLQSPKTIIQAWSEFTD